MVVVVVVGAVVVIGVVVVAGAVVVDVVVVPTVVVGAVVDDCVVVVAFVEDVGVRQSRLPAWHGGFESAVADPRPIEKTTTSARYCGM